MLGKEGNKLFHDEFVNARKTLSDSYDLLMKNSVLTVQEKLELSRSFSKIIWNLDDLVWTFEPNKEA